MVEKTRKLSLNLAQGSGLSDATVGGPDGGVGGMITPTYPDRSVYGPADGQKDVWVHHFTWSEFCQDTDGWFYV